MKFGFLEIFGLFGNRVEKAGESGTVSTGFLCSENPWRATIERSRASDRSREKDWLEGYSNFGQRSGRNGFTKFEGTGNRTRVESWQLILLWQVSLKLSKTIIEY